MYQEYNVTNAIVVSGHIASGAKKLLNNITNGKSYLRITDVGQEPTDVPSDFLMQDINLGISINIQPVNGGFAVINDGAGNAYILWSEISIQ